MNQSEKTMSNEEPTNDAPKAKEGTELSALDEEIATKFRKMLKMGMPKGALIQKMCLEGVPRHVQDSVVTLTPEEEEIAASYRTMLKMGMSDSEVIEKMNAENVPQHVQYSVLAGEGLLKVQSIDRTGRIRRVEEETAAKFICRPKGRRCGWTRMKKVNEEEKQKTSSGEKMGDVEPAKDAPKAKQGTKVRTPGEIYVRADGKKVRRVKKPLNVRPGDQVEIITRPDGKKVRRIRRRKQPAEIQPGNQESVVAADKLPKVPEPISPVVQPEVCVYKELQHSNERSDILKKHYRGKLLQVAKANGSCESMGEIQDKIELAMMTWITDDMKATYLCSGCTKKELDKVSNVLQEMMPPIMGVCGRSGMQFRKTDIENPDPRSIIECCLAEELIEAFDVFTKYICNRLKKLEMTCQRIKSNTDMLQKLLVDVHERNVKTIKALGPERLARSRKLKTQEDIEKVAKEKMKEAEEIGGGGGGRPPHPMAGRGGGGRGGLLDAIAGRGRGRGGGGRGGLLDAIAGRGRGRGGGRRGGLLDAIQGRGRGGGRGGRGGLLEAIQGRGRGGGGCGKRKASEPPKTAAKTTDGCFLVPKDQVMGDPGDDLILVKKEQVKEEDIILVGPNDDKDYINVDIVSMDDLLDQMEKLKNDSAGAKPRIFGHPHLPEDKEMLENFIRKNLCPAGGKPKNEPDPPPEKKKEGPSSSVAEFLNQMADAGKMQEVLERLEDAEKRETKLKKQLCCSHRPIAEDIDYDVCIKRIDEIGKRMNEIGGSDVTHPDKERQNKLREEYFKLEQDMEKYNSALLVTDEYVAEQKRKWEDDNAPDNLEALKKLRRHMPVEVRNMSENQLSKEPGPNGKYLPTAIAKKFKRTNVLQLIRRDPDDIVLFHPATLENMRVCGITLTERRAVHEHLKPCALKWKIQRDENKMAERRWEWYKMLEDNFKDRLISYHRHVEEYGPPGNHDCPLIGKQCPVKHDKLIDYDGDYGYTEEPSYCYEFSKLYSPFPCGRCGSTCGRGRGGLLQPIQGRGRGGRGGGRGRLLEMIKGRGRGGRGRGSERERLLNAIRNYKRTEAEPVEEGWVVVPPAPKEDANGSSS